MLLRKGGGSMRSYISEPLSGSITCFHTATPKISAGFLYPLCLGRYQCDDSYHVYRESYDSFLFMLVLDGRGYLKIDGKTHQLTKGCAALVDCYRPHSYGALGSFSFLWLHFDGATARNYYSYLTERLGQVFTPSQKSFGSMKLLITQLLSGVLDGTAPELQMACWITQLLTLPVLDGDFSDSEVSYGSSLSQRACGYMRSRYQNPLSVDEVASFLSVSTCHFIRQFKKETGMTPHSYLLSVRINSAKFYLKTTSDSVKEIGFRCGFQSENHFCISFKKATGMTPSGYRGSAGEVSSER